MKIARCLSVQVPCALAAPGAVRAQHLTQDSSLLRNSGDLVALCSATPNDPLYTAAVNFFRSVHKNQQSAYEQGYAAGRY